MLHIFSGLSSSSGYEIHPHALPIESSEINSHSYPRLSIDANQIKWVKVHFLILDFWLIPNRSYVHHSYQMNFYWKLRMDCFATTFIFDEMWGFRPKEGMSWKNHFPHDLNLELFIWPTELHILFHYGAMNIPEFIYPEIKPLTPWAWSFITKIMLILDISMVFCAKSLQVLQSS